MYFDASRFKTVLCMNDLRNKSCRYQKVPWCCLFIHGDDYKNKNLGPYAAIAGQRAYNKMINEARRKKNTQKTRAVVTEEGKEEEDVVVSEASIVNTSPVVLPKLSQVPAVLRGIITTTQVESPQWIWPPLPELEAVSYDRAVKAITEYHKERAEFVGVVCSICGDTTDVTPHHYKCGCSDYFCKNHFMLVMHINVKCQNQLCPMTTWC